MTIILVFAKLFQPLRILNSHVQPTRTGLNVVLVSLMSLVAAFLDRFRLNATPCQRVLGCPHDYRRYRNRHGVAYPVPLFFLSRNHQDY